VAAGVRQNIKTEKATSITYSIKVIEYYLHKIDLFDFCSSKEFYEEFNKLVLDKKNLINKVIERIYFDELIHKIEDRSLIEKFKWNLRIYLLLSASDALGSGCSFYSFENNYLNKKNFIERDSIIDEVVNKQTNSREEIIDIIKKLYDNYKSHQSVKQSFYKFWNSRSNIIKEKLIKSFYCFKSEEYIEYDVLIDSYLYKLFRNDFTHSAKTNLPALPELDLIIKYNKHSDNGLVVMEAHYLDRVLEFKTPITNIEKEMMINKNVRLFAKRLYNNDLKELDIETIDYNVNLNLGFSSLTQIGGKEYAINASIIETIKYALYEGIMSILDIEIDWASYYNEKYFT